jgi:acyl carrier protein
MEKDRTQQLVGLEDVREAIAISLGIAEDDITSTTKLVDLADSLDQAQLMLDLEADFKCEITDDQIAKLFTVQDIVDFLNGTRSQ